MSATTRDAIAAGAADHSETVDAHRRHATALTLPLRDRFGLDDQTAGAIRDVLQRTANRPVAQAVADEILANGDRPDPLGVQRACRRHIDRSGVSTACHLCDGTLWVDADPIDENGQTYSAVTKCPRCFPAR